MPAGAPGLRVVSREFSEEFGGRVVIEAVQAGAVVIGDEGGRGAPGAAQRPTGARCTAARNRVRFFYRAGVSLLGS